jgi:small GTP-binding protein
MRRVAAFHPSVGIPRPPISTRWQQRGAVSRGPPAFLGKMREQEERKQVAFPLPSVMQIESFVHLIDDFYTKARRLAQAPDRVRKTAMPVVDKHVIDYARIAKDLQALTNVGYIKEELVRRGMLTADRSMQGAPLLPFQIARDLILRHISNPNEREFMKAKGITYVEKDRYLAVDRLTGGERRTPTVGIMGHVDHGKTTLLDTLQQSAITTTEDGKITQVIRAFTIGISAINYPTEVTFIDTPGHKLFAELRLTGQHAVDYVLLIIALDEGVQRQTEEVVRTALHLRKPLLIAFNKVDLFQEPAQLAAALAAAAEALSAVGVRLKLVDSIDTLRTLEADGDSFAKYCEGKVLLFSPAQGAAVAGPKSTKRGKPKKAKVSLQEALAARTAAAAASPPPQAASTGGDPAVSAPSAATKVTMTTEDTLKMPAIAVCISAKHNTNVNLLVNVIRAFAQRRPPTCDMVRPPVQAKVIESFKVGQAVVISCLVRNGVLRRGMHFIVDQSYGTVKNITDMFGGTMPEITAGRSGCVYGTINAGSPAPGTHIIEVPTVEIADDVTRFRLQLHRFLEKHCKLAHLLRPEGMSTHFMHVGNYGQVDEHNVGYEHKLLFNQPAGEASTDAHIEQQWLTSQQPEAERAKTEEEAMEQMKAKVPVVVFAKVDSYHSARLLMREIPRLGTKDVAFFLVSVGYGTISEAEVVHVPKLDIVVSFRGPKLTCGRAGYALDSKGVAYREFRVYSDLLDFFKKYAVDKQHKYNIENDAKKKASERSSAALIEAHGFGAEKKARLRTLQQLKVATQTSADDAV